MYSKSLLNTPLDMPGAYHGELAAGYHLEIHFGPSYSVKGFVQEVFTDGWFSLRTPTPLDTCKTVTDEYNLVEVGLMPYANGKWHPANWTTLLTENREAQDE